MGFSLASGLPGLGLHAKLDKGTPARHITATCWEVAMIYRSNVYGDKSTHLCGVRTAPPRSGVAVQYATCTAGLDGPASLALALVEIL